MLKHLLVSGWFRVQPFLKYAVVVILIAPLVAASAHSSAAKSQAIVSVAEKNSVSEETVDLREPDGVVELETVPIDTLEVEAKSPSEPDFIVAFGETQLLQPDAVESITTEILTTEESLSESVPIQEEPLAAVELAPPIPESGSVQLRESENTNSAQVNLIARIKAAKLKHLARRNASDVVKTIPPTPSAKSVKIAALKRELKLPTDAPVVQEPDPAELAQSDPIGSPYPVPWKWIEATQKTLGSRGMSGVRYYRSVPVVSPDGRYAIYSRVQLEVKPHMHESKVSSVLFVEDRQTKRMRVVASTSGSKDPLLAKNSSRTTAEAGKIGVLVPVGWSNQGERFLARKFEGVFNTADATDRALIWDRQLQKASTVAPSQKEYQHDIAVLLGWSPNQPNNVVFRAGEMGQEDWPIVTVSTDGKTTLSADQIQPATVGEKVIDVWTNPQVVYQ